MTDRLFTLTAALSVALIPLLTWWALSEWN